MLSCRLTPAVRAAAGCLLLALRVAPANAQRVPTGPADRWTVAGTYLHVGARPIHRRAEPSMSVTLGRALGSGDPTRAMQLELGWLRASRVTTQAQGATAGLSASIPLGTGTAWDVGPGPTVVVHPGFAVLAGWAEAQRQEVLYGWQGIAGSPLAGQTGTELKSWPVRGRTTGAGLSLAADLRLTRSISVTASVQRWAFTGPVVRPNRLATLAGAGLAVHPGSLVAGARQHAAGRPATVRAHATVPVAARGDTTTTTTTVGGTR